MFELVILFYILSQISLFHLIRKAQDNLKYSTIFCRDVRASLGMFEYRTNVEAKRHSLNAPNSKF